MPQDLLNTFLNMFSSENEDDARSTDNIVHETKGELIYEGKAKKIWSVIEDSDHYICEFKDDTTAFNAKKKASIPNKGRLNCAISTLVFEELHKYNIKTHFVKKLDDTHILVKKLNIILIEFVIRNITTGSIVPRLGVVNGAVLDNPLLEYFYKRDDLDDPLITKNHVEMLDLTIKANLYHIDLQIIAINLILKKLFKSINLTLVDFKLEFGETVNGDIVLGDEFSPDNCRLWDVNGKSLDKDIFRNDTGDLITAYEEVYRRLVDSRI